MTYGNTNTLILSTNISESAFLERSQTTPLTVGTFSDYFLKRLEQVVSLMW